MVRESREHRLGAVRADLHIHSYVSDGGSSPAEIVRYSKLRGLDVISITDHDTFLGSYIALRADSRIVVVPGAEFRTELGDVVVLCEDVPFESMRRLGLKDGRTRHARLSLVLSLASEENCVTVAVHPFALMRWGGGRLFELPHVICVEVYNGSSDPLTNLYAAYVARSKECKLASSDAHVVDMVGTAYTLIEVDHMSREGVIESIRKARTRPVYRTLTDSLKSFASMKSRLTHSIRTRLGIYGDPWERVARYPV